MAQKKKRMSLKKIVKRVLMFLIPWRREAYFHQVKDQRRILHLVMEKTGWDARSTKRNIREASRRGIPDYEYFQHSLYLLPPDQQHSCYQEILNAETSQRRTEKKQKKDRDLNVICAATGWSKEEAWKQVTDARRNAGCNLHQYVLFRFWELTPEEQRTYMTYDFSQSIRRKYNDITSVRRITTYKDLTCKKYASYLRRPWLSMTELNEDTFLQRFSGEESVVYKPRDAYGGIGIQFLDLTPETSHDVFEKLRELPDGVIEGFVHQHPQMRKLSVHSVNTLRIVTVHSVKNMPEVENGKVYVCIAALRMGAGDSFVDNFHGGGLVANVDLETGMVTTDGVDGEGGTHACHPDTGEPIKGFQIPCFREAIQMVEEMGRDLPGYYGWDIAITETGPALIELNADPGQSTVQLPFVSQRLGVRHLFIRFLQPES